MKRFFISLGLGLALAPNAAGADEPPAQASCEIGSQPLIGGDPHRVTTGGNGVSDAFADQLIELTNRMLRDRINPQTVLAKLDEVERVPDDGVARGLNDLQRQAIIQTLHGQDTAQIMITAHPSVDDSAGYAKELATPLLMAGVHAGVPARHNAGRGEHAVQRDARAGTPA